MSVDNTVKSIDASLLMEMGKQFKYYNSLLEQNIEFRFRFGVDYFIKIFENRDHHFAIRVKALAALETFAPASPKALLCIVQGWVKEYGDMATYCHQALYRLMENNDRITEDVRQLLSKWGIGDE